MTSINRFALHRPGFERCLLVIFALLLPALAISDAVGLVRYFGATLYKEQLLAVYLGLAMTISFLYRPLIQGKDKTLIPWYDYLLALAALATTCYVSVNYEQIFMEIYLQPTVPAVITGIILLLLLDALRRAAGKVLFFFLLMFFLIGIASAELPAALQGRSVPLKEYILYLGLDSNALLGVPISVVSTIVVCFIFFGNLLNRSYGSVFFTDIAMASMGHYRGGGAKIAIIASSLFGSISGSAVANVASSGVISIPLMKKTGFSPHAAGGIEAVASTGGQLMPPMMGAAAFVMAELLQVDFTDIVLAALIPAILYYFAIFVRVDLYAAKFGIEAVTKTRGETASVFKSGWFYFVPFAIIVFALFSMNTSPQYAALLAAAFLLPLGLFVGYKKSRMKLKDIYLATVDTGLSVFTIVLISSMAGVVIGVLNITGIGFALTQVMVSFADTSIFLLLILAAVISIILGMGMPTLGVYLLLATLVAPAMVRLDIDPIAAHMFALYFGMLSMITPPVCVAAFTAASIADSDPMRTGYSAAAFGWSAYVVPFIFVLSPELLMQGEAMDIVQITVTTALGIYITTSGFTGYFIKPVGAISRLLLITLGGLTLLPNHMHEFLYVADVAALLAVLWLIAVTLVNLRSTRKSGVSLHASK